MYYVYTWSIIETGEVFYIGKGRGNRYVSLKGRNKYFMRIVNKHNCVSELLYIFDIEKDAFDYEKYMISKFKAEGLARANFHEGGSGGDTLKYASDEDKAKFIETMTKINKERCSADEFKKNKSKYMKKKYMDKSEREKQSKRMKEAWNDELRAVHSEKIKQSYTDELRQKRRDMMNKPILFKFEGSEIRFKSRDTFLEYMKKQYNLSPCNRTLAKLLSGNKFIAYRNIHKCINGFTIEYI